VSEIFWVFSRFQISDALDIFLVALIFYALLQLVRGTQAIQLLRGVIIFIFITVLLSNVLSLTAFSWLISNILPALLVAIPVIFQPELRKALERIGRAGGLIDRPMREAAANRAITQVARACRILSGSRYGALVVFERHTGLQDYADTGVEIDAEVSSDLLLTIFFPNTALHDGAVIIREDRVVAAAALLPLGNLQRKDQRLGTRHRAAIGITEQTDAIAVVVSEETGIISVAHSGRMVRHLDENRLRSILQRLHQQYAFDLSSLLPSRVAQRGERGGAKSHRS
jgi:diadenylate cyclase